MRYTAIGYRGTEDNVRQLRIFDNKTCKFIERDYSALAQFLHKPSKVENLEIQNGRLVWTCGSISRYPNIHSNGVITNKNATTITKRHRIGNDVYMYLVVAVTGEYHWLTKEQVAKVNETAPITNCKVFIKNNDIVIQHIAGEFDDEETELRVERGAAGAPNVIYIPSGTSPRVLDLRHKFIIDNRWTFVPEFYKYTLETILNPSGVYIDSSVNSLMNVKTIINDNDDTLCIDASKETEHLDYNTKITHAWKSLETIKTKGELDIEGCNEFEFKNLSTIEATKIRFTSSYRVRNTIDYMSLDMDTVSNKLYYSYPNIKAYSSSGTFELTKDIERLEGKFENIRNLKKVILNAERLSVTYNYVSNFDGIISIPEFFLSNDVLNNAFPNAIIQTRRDEISDTHRKKLDKLNLLGQKYTSDSDEGFKHLVHAASDNSIQALLVKAINVTATEWRYKAAFGPYEFEFAINNRKHYKSPKIFDNFIKFNHEGKLVIVPYTKDALLITDTILLKDKSHGYAGGNEVIIPSFQLENKGPIENIRLDFNNKQIIVKFKNGVEEIVTSENAH